MNISLLYCLADIAADYPDFLQDLSLLIIYIHNFWSSYEDMEAED